MRVSLILGVLWAALGTGCSKLVDLGDLGTPGTGSILPSLSPSPSPIPSTSPSGISSTPPGTHPTFSPSPSPVPSSNGGGSHSSGCGPNQTLHHWSFVQPTSPASACSLDLLFVIDTSSSMISRCTQLASTIPSFIQQLPTGTDYRVGVMLAHGGASPYSGHLYSPSGVSPVLSSNDLSPSQVQDGLKTTLSKIVSDKDEAGGRMGMYSLGQSLASSRVTEIQAQGFFRSSAALSIVFVSDKNDACYPPDLHGFTQFPDFVPSVEDPTGIAYHRYCVDSLGQPKITPGATLAALQSLRSGSSLTLGAIIHDNPKMTRVTGSEDSIGHGYLELVQSVSGGVIIDLDQSSYAENLAALGCIPLAPLKLKTTFDLTGVTGVLKDTVQVTVDGAPVSSTYNATSGEVQIPPGNSGTWTSPIEVSACCQ